ncbi:ATP-binding protein [Pseudorhodoplanes sp.]|uniref:ATP-binding protein n=1 Tax=Pseudorhodoplanes sp. TaxID=1934341 RepID=UPI00391D8C6B
MTIRMRSLKGGWNWTTQSRFWITRGALGAALVVIFVAMEWLSSIHEFMSVPITPWNPGLGVVFAFMLLYGPHFGLALFVGMIAAELIVVRTALQWPVILAVAAIISLVYAAAAVVLRRSLRLDAGLYHLRDLVVLLAGGIAAAFVSSALVAVLLLLDDRIALDNVATAATPLLLGDLIGISVVTPLTLRVVMLVQGRAWLAGYSKPLLAEVVFYAALSCAALLIIVGGESGSGLRYFYLLFVPVVLAAVRHGFDGACLALAVTQFALVGLMHHFGYDAKAFTEMQTLMLVLTGTALVVGAVVSERQQAEAQRRLAEHRLREKEMEASRAARFTLVSGMASALAHEINQPMTAARALARSAQHLLEGPSPDLQRARANLDNAISQIDHASDVMRRMREFLRRGRPHMSSFSIGETIENAVALARPDITSRGIAISWSIPDRIPMGHGDSVQIEQVILNLIRNATEALSGAAVSGGAIRVDAKYLPGPDRIEIAVGDNGPGVPAGLAEAMFEPLTTSKSEGLGLGLPICLAIVESHGGRLWMQSGEPGRTEFRFSLPLEPRHNLK